MKNIETEKTLEKLKKLSHKNQRDKLKKYSIEILELLAVEIYEKSYKRNDLLDIILFERAVKLDDNFEWTNENKQKFLNVNDKFMQIFESAYNEALSSAFELESRIKNNDKFIKDYEIEIEITPYMHKQFYDDKKNNFGYVLSEPESNNSIIEYSFGHSNYDSEIKEKPVYLDKSMNWNIEYFGDTFNDNYICYAIHRLLDTDRWSFYDIININKIWADVEVIHQYYEENI
jgi:hypothetical protein